MAIALETEERSIAPGLHGARAATATLAAADTLLHLQRDLVLERRWLVDGTHYQRTADAWLANQDRHRDALLPILAQAYGGDAAARLWFQRWRMFWMACAELFGYEDGQQWLVAHYLFAPRT